MVFVIFLLIGLLIGSFLNVLVYRLHVVEDLIWDRSKCPHCHHMIRWYDNIPIISFILLRFQCRDCKKKISWQYPAVEAATGIVFALTAAYFTLPFDPLSWLHLFFYLGIFSIFIIIFVYDALYMEIPMSVFWVGVTWAFLYYIILDALTLQAAIPLTSLNLLPAVISGLAVFVFFFVLSYFSKETWMGAGDAYVAFLVGMVVSWPLVVPAMLLSFSLGSVWGILLIAIKKKNMKSQIPFAPFLVLGGVLILFLVRMYPFLENYAVWSF